MKQKSSSKPGSAAHAFAASGLRPSATSAYAAEKPPILDYAPSLRAARSEQVKKKMAGTGHIHHKGQKDKPLGERTQAANPKRSRVWARVEHVFAQQEAMGGMLVRTIGITRARFKIGMKNLVYNWGLRS